MWQHLQIWGLPQDFLFLKIKERRKLTTVEKNILQRVTWFCKLASSLTFVAEGQSPLFSCLYAAHPNVIVIDEANKVRVSRADLGVHTWACTLALNLCGIHWRCLHKTKSKQRTTEVTASATKDAFKFNHKLTLLLSWCLLIYLTVFIE